MRFATGSAFRQALEDRLRNQAHASGVPLVRLRKLVAFDRFLARLAAIQPDRWVLKGGLGLQLRLGERARTTQDVDLLLTLGDPFALLAEAARADLGDWFAFEVSLGPSTTGGAQRARRFSTRSLLDSRTFETFRVDVGLEDALLLPGEMLSGAALLAFADLQPARVLCYSLGQQLAEKVHAYSMPRLSREGSRVRDLIDILVIASLATLEAATLRSVLQATFDRHATHPVPRFFPPPPAGWAIPYRRLARDVKSRWLSLAEANEAASRFLDPILEGSALTCWDPQRWRWS